MKKFLISLIFIFGCFFDVYAKEIIVDGISYDDERDFAGEGFSYAKDYKRLFLDGYDGGIIAYDDSLEIWIKNTNIINGNGAEVGINTKKLGVFGEGTLNIIDTNIGVKSGMVYFDKVTSLIIANDIGIEVTSTSGCLLSKSKVVVEESDVGISCLGGVNINYTTLNIVKGNKGINGNKLKLYLVSADLYVDSRDSCLGGLSLIEINNSQVSLKSNSSAIPDKNLIKKDNNMFYVSNNDSNYIIDDYYWNYPYFRLSINEKIDDLLISDEGLIFEIDKSFLIKDNEDLKDVVTKSEYTNSEFDETIILNPDTFDNIYMFFSLGGICLIILIFLFRRKCGRVEATIIK